jgi:hypothetical protein
MIRCIVIVSVWGNGPDARIESTGQIEAAETFAEKKKNTHYFVCTTTKTKKL